MTAGLLSALRRCPATARARVEQGLCVLLAWFAAMILRYLLVKTIIEGRCVCVCVTRHLHPHPLTTLTLSPPITRRSGKTSPTGIGAYFVPFGQSLAAM